VSGEDLPTRFIIVNGANEFPVASLESIVPVVRQIGTRNLEIKRFQGLGEMNPDQLWETTLDAEARTLAAGAA